MAEDKGETQALFVVKEQTRTIKSQSAQGPTVAVAITEFVIDSGAQQTLCGRLFARVGFWPSKA